MARLPEPVFSVPYSTVLRGRHQQLLGVRLARDGQWRFTPGSTVPEKYATAVVAFEDRRFWVHPGVDPLAVARAVKTAILQRKIKSGASTLSMQVIRLSRNNPPRTFREKVLEFLLAFRLTLHKSKTDVLSLYAGHAPFGGNVVGLDAASWRFFGRPPDRLSWAEACTLAVLPNNPSLVHPGKNRERLKTKRNALLHRLAQQGKITPEDLRLALAEKLPPKPTPWPNKAPHLLETLRDRFHSEGQTLSSPLDEDLQDFLTELLSRRGNELRQRGVRHVAALILDNRNFDVLAYVGNVPSSNPKTPGDAVDIIQRPRSTGSVLKPFLYALALQEGTIGPTTLLPDVPTRVGGFHPENMDKTYQGAVPAETALARSLNVPAVRLLRHYGVAKFHESLITLGLTTLFRAPDDYGLSLIIGGAEGTLWDITTLYANLAASARGEKQIRRAVLVQKKTETAGPPSPIGPGAAWLVQKALVDVSRPGDEAHWQIFANARRISWKTGTSQGYRDAWAVGSDAQHTVGIWAGNADGEGVADLTGGRTAAPILFDVFNRLDSGGWFPLPENDLREISVCRDDGLRSVEGCATETQWIPLNSSFDRQSPHHRFIHLDPSGKHQVHSGCETVGRMKNETWFVLPPAQEYFYRPGHPDYRPLPSFRSDCRDTAPLALKDTPLEFLYPDENSIIYIPRDLGGGKSRVVFEVVHRDTQQFLNWHLDKTYLGRTHHFHQQALDIEPGDHTITVVDSAGHRLSRRFKVVGNNSKEEQ